MSELDELEAKLQAMREWCRRAPDEEAGLAYQSQLKAERELALAKGEETATARLGTISLMNTTPRLEPSSPPTGAIC